MQIYEVRDYEVVFVIDTTKYTGNFEREICEHVIGFNDPYDTIEFSKEFLTEAGEELINEIKSKITPVMHDEYAEVYVTLVSTPNMVNNGYGKITSKEEQPDAKSPAYCSVGIFFNSEPSEKLIDFMKKRAYSFMDEVTGFRILKMERTVVETETILGN